MNTKAKYIMTCIGLCLITSNFKMQAQIISKNSESIENFKSSILSISEFKARFNANMGKPHLRKSDILSLLSENSKVSKSDFELFTSQISGILSITLKGIELTTDAMLAKVQYQGICVDDSCTLQMLLQKKRVGQKVWWELVDFWSPFVDSLFTKRQKTFIPPHAEEMNFVTLSTDRPENHKIYGSYLSDDFKVDPLSTLVALVTTGQLKLNYASRTQLYITEFEGWILTLERDTSGWKITDLKPSNQTSEILTLKNEN